MKRYEKTWRTKAVCVVIQQSHGSHVHNFACDCVTLILGTWCHFGGAYLMGSRQGGPHNHQIGALAVQLLEVDSPMFKEWS